MNIPELNNLLSTFAEQKRENIISFSFALLEWMGITPNTDVPGHVGEIRPRLTTPQTQKLKDFLAPAPLTVQPQLYRLSAEGQNMKVRFAVLKKLKKDTISQLVDNDLGLTSYQASIRGIINVPGRPPYIPQQPYFIHFVTTPAYNKLVLIFNQGDQKRLVTFRNRLTKTQFHKILEKWQGIGTQPKPEIADVLWKSLDIKEVNKEFYKQIKERFDTLVGFAKTENTGSNEEAIKQFSVRLIGRYIFCWFLKEKGVIPPALLSSETIRNYQDSFSQLFLKKLFFKTLNAEVTDPGRTETITSLDDLYKTIPYLNGGLFDFHQEDVLFDQLDLNNWLITFVKVLEEFDFTVDESSSQYQMVAIDPEMLGRIFENLLASQNPDTEKMANQRKAFGAFYTPREIVDYMVNESLRAYLETQLMPTPTEDLSKLNEPMVEYRGTLFQHLVPQQTLMSFQDKKTAADNDRRREKIKANLNKLFSPDCSDNPFDKEDTLLVRKALSEITVLDPACGSGAFPMGMMLRLMELRQIVGHGHRNSYDLKEEILSRNIFGVDIMPMAVEIARLRAWLSLVLEADYKPADRKNNFGIAALPNLDFKFICANSLIDSGYDAFLEKIQYNATLFRLDGEIQKLENIRNQYFDPRGDKARKTELQQEFLATKQLIKEQISVGTLIKNYNLADFFDKVDDWNPFDDSHPSSFFSPAWMFGIRNGFDVVIGNPPYGIDFDENSKEYLKSRFAYLVQRIRNSFLYFIGIANEFLKKGGVFSYIVPNEFLFQIYMEKARKFFLSNTEFLIAVNTGEEIFEAIVPSCIVLIKKNRSKNYSVALKDLRGKEFQELLKELKTETFDLTQSSHILESPNATFSFNKSNSKLVHEIIKRTKPFEEYCDDIANGISTSCDEIYIVDSNFAMKSKFEKKYLKASIRGSHFNKFYCPEKTDEFVLYITPDFEEEEAPNIFEYLTKNKDLLIKKCVEKNKGTRKWHLLFRHRDETLFVSPKIIIRQTGDRIIAAIDSCNYYCIDSVNVAKIKEQYKKEMPFLIGLINSQLSKFIYQEISQESGRVMAQVKPQRVRQMPIAIASNSKKNQIEKLVNEIIQNKKQNQDTTALEKEIDVLVYKLYELTYDEVKIIDKDFWMSEEEYYNFAWPPDENQT